MGKLIDRFKAKVEASPVDEKRQKELRAAFGIAVTSAAAAAAFQLGLLNLGSLTELSKSNPEAALQKLQSGMQAANGITLQGYQFPGLATDPSGLSRRVPVLQLRDRADALPGRVCEREPDG